MTPADERFARDAEAIGDIWRADRAKGDSGFRVPNFPIKTKTGQAIEALGEAFAYIC
jgi:hypothetical protein